MTTRHAAPPVPASAGAVFGDRLPLAVRYAEMLCDAGVERGLVGPGEAPRIWPRHLFNSVAVSAHVPHGSHVIDLGSGAGLPGIPLALARVDCTVTLVEPMQRRVDFLQECVTALGLDVAVVRGRAEDVDMRADVVVARAVAPLERLLPWASLLLGEAGTLVALKGSRATAEIAATGRAAMSGWGPVEVVTEAVAGEAATLVVARRLARPARTGRTA